MSDKQIDIQRKQYILKVSSPTEIETTRSTLKDLGIVSDELPSWFIIFCSDVQYNCLTSEYGFVLLLDEDDGVGY